MKISWLGTDDTPEGERFWRVLWWTTLALALGLLWASWGTMPPR